MHRLKLTTALPVIAFVGLARCGDATGSGDHCSPTIMVGSGTTPQFSWAPACKIQALEVFAGSACSPRFECWKIESLSDNQISSPVRYGRVPSTARQLSPPLALQRGLEYAVSLERYEDFDGRTLIEVAVAAFTP